MKIVVTGCARSGTQYTARLLEMLGLRAGHESVYRSCPDDLASLARPIEKAWWDRDVEVSWPAAAYLSLIPGNTVVWHQVRDPLKVIRCWHSHQYLTQTNDAGQFIQRFIPQCSQGNDLARCVSYYLRWNEKIEREGARFLYYTRYRVEQLTPEHLHALLLIANIVMPVNKIQEAMQELNHIGGCVPGAHIELAWKDIAMAPDADALIAMKRRYGYG